MRASVEKVYFSRRNLHGDNTVTDDGACDDDKREILFRLWPGSAIEEEHSTLLPDVLHWLFTVSTRAANEVGR